MSTITDDVRVIRQSLWESSIKIVHLDNSVIKNNAIVEAFERIVAAMEAKGMLE